MMRDICARFKYSERDSGTVGVGFGVGVGIGPPPSSPAVSTPRSTMTDRERSGSEHSLDGGDDYPSTHASNVSDGSPTTSANESTPTITIPTSTPQSGSTLPTPTPCECPPRELIHRNLRKYHRDMEAGKLDLAAVGARILEDVSPYSVLKLGGFSLGNIAPKLLANVLVQSSNLRTLDLGFNRINDRGAALLAKALEQNSSLTSLYLSGNDIGPIGAGSLATALVKNTTLRSLHLSGNNIGEDGAKELANGLTQNSSLRALYVGTNGIGGPGMECFAEMLQVNQHLEELTLGQNKIGSLGLQHLAAAFATGRVQLTTLEIGKNQIDADGVVALAKALCTPTRTRLQNLYVDNNPIGDAGAGAFGALLAKNATLRVLDLSYTQMSLLGLRDLSLGLSYSASLLCLLLDGHDWASTQYMKKTNGLNGMSLSAKGANTFAAQCIAGAINANVKSALYKLTGVELPLVLHTLPSSTEDRALLSGDVDVSGRRPVDLVTRNERILRYMQDQRVAVNLNKRKNSDVVAAAEHRNHEPPQRQHNGDDAVVGEPKLQRRRTSSENYQNLTVDTSAAAAAAAPARPPLRPTMTTATPSPSPTGLPPIPLDSRSAATRASLLRNQLPRHPSWTSTERRLSIKSPRYESTMEVQVRKVIADIAKLPFNADEYANLQTYYLGGCHGLNAALAPVADSLVPHASPSSSADAIPEPVPEQVPCPACRSSRLAQYPQSMILKTRLESLPESEKLVLVLLRQLHYLVGVFQHIDNAEPKIDAIVVSAHEGSV